MDTTAFPEVNDFTFNPDNHAIGSLVIKNSLNMTEWLNFFKYDARILLIL